MCVRARGVQFLLYTASDVSAWAPRTPHYYRRYTLMCCFCKGGYIRFILHVSDSGVPTYGSCACRGKGNVTRRFAHVTPTRVLLRVQVRPRN